MNARMERICLRGTLLAALIGFAGCGGGTPEGAVDPACVLDDPDGDEGEKSPGYPFSYEAFKTDIAPLIVASCATANCHAVGEPPAGGNGGYTVWAGAVDNECDRVQSFKSFRDKSILYAPDTSPIYVSVTAGTTASGVAHPFSTTLGNFQQGDADKILTFLQAANAICAAEGTCGGPAQGGVDFFDLNKFTSDVQPALDAANCAGNAACHVPPAAASNNFAIILNPATPEDVKLNYESVKSRIALDTLQDPKQSLFYFNSVTAHAGGVSTQIAAADRPKIEAWIAAAKKVFDESNIPEQGCADPAQLDARVFAEDILPILRGDVDLNNRGDDGNAVGCVRGPCHGQARPGALTLIDGTPPEEMMKNFACFVNLTSPSSSPVLLCPLGDPRCPKFPHPGDRIFDGADDLNYQALLSFLFSTANSENVPIDLAFFARRINPIFDNVNAVDEGDQNRTCAETVSCHGVQISGQNPPNGSNFGIIPNAGDNINVLKTNFIEAAAFTNFLSADQSSLFLYPTNEIANEANPAATGIQHPGCNADCFPVGSEFADNILIFAEGLQADAVTGDQLNWLIAGDFQGIVDIDDNTPIDEDNLTPAIFDRSNGQELAGRWDAVFFDDAVDLNGELVVDVDAFLNGVAGNGRAAFAAAYIVNTTNIRQEVKFILTSVNDTRLFVGPSVAEGEAGQTVTLTAFIEPSRQGEVPLVNRVFIKLFEEIGQNELNFNLKMLDENNQPFDAQDMIIRLQPTGGI
jgi:hypothetical protein